MQALSVLAFFLCIGVVLFSSLMYYAERLMWPNYDIICCTEHGAAEDFPDIIETFWWSIVTMTTVGFGDQYPRTTQGRIVGVCCMLCGIILISLPVAIVGSKFQEAYEDMEDAQFAEAVASLQTDKDGAIDFTKMSGKLVKGGAPAAPKHKDQVPPAPEITKRLNDLRSTLKELQTADQSQVSFVARAKIAHLLDLVEKARKIDGNVALLKEKDFRLQKAITKDFDQVSILLRGTKKKGKKEESK